MTKLLNAHRNHIVGRVIAATFAEREERLRKAEHALGLRVLRSIYGDDALRRMAELPDGWLMTTDNIFVNVTADRRAYIKVERLRVPAEIAQSYNTPSLSDEDRAIFDDLRAHQMALANEKSLLARQVTAVLAAITTVERLAAEWPEGYVHFPHALAPVTNLPALRIEDLNARLAAAREAA